MVEATTESVKQHVVPKWFDDAKLGIMIHWGLYSVPAYAPVSQGSIMDEMKAKGLAALKEAPYSEWYMNSMSFKDCKTYQYHSKKYGADFEYKDFRPIFDKEAEKLNAAEWADLFQASGAKYVVLITKHHDGYCLWPTDQVNPNREHWHTDRDYVGEVTDAVRAAGLKMGLYYSGVFDWTFDYEPLLFAVLLRSVHAARSDVHRLLQQSGLRVDRPLQTFAFCGTISAIRMERI